MTYFNMANNFNHVDCDASKLDIEVNRIIQDIGNGHKVMVLMRGLPGSGKSTLARKIFQSTVGNNPLANIFSTDDFFTMENGKYQYDPAKINDAHNWNRIRSGLAMREGITPIIIDNTNLELWEMKPYAEDAIEYGYLIKILEAKTSWSQHASELARRNRHGVPVNKIRKMLERYQQNISVDYFLKYFNLAYSPQNAPLKIKQQPVLSNKIQERNEKLLNVPTTSSIQNNVSIKPSDDLIDLTENEDGWILAKSSKNSDKKISLNNIDVPWTDSWAGNTSKDVTPKPQRNLSSKGLLNMSSVHLQDTKSPNWNPIGKIMNTWDKTDAPSQKFSSSLSNNMLVYCNASTSTSNMNQENDANCKILFTNSRDINAGGSSSRSVPSKTVVTFDKGVSTWEEEDEQIVSEEDKQRSLMELKVIFEDIPESYVKYVLEECNGDFNATLDILLDAKKSGVDFITFNYSNETTKKAPLNKEEKDASTSDPVETIDKIPSKKNDPSRTKFVKKDKIPSPVDEMLKNNINFEFNNEHNSAHYQLMRKKAHEKKTKSEEIENVPSTSKINNHSFSESSDDSDNGSKTLSFRMGREFFHQLDVIYGTSSAWDENLEPVIHIPESLLNQIYALWLESVCNQLEVQKHYVQVIMEEDEQLARELQAKEREQDVNGEEPAVANLSDIMDMELVLANYNASANSWEESPEDLATKLTQLKLQQMFPEIEENTLTEIYRAHDNSFEQTFHVLLLSTGKISSSQTESVSQNELRKLLAEQERNLLERAKEKQNELNGPDSFNDEETITVLDADGNPKFIDNKTAVSMFRKQASHYLNLRNLHFNKAKECMMKGMLQCANYYYQMASLYVKKYDYFNNLAASRLMQVNSSGVDSYTLDMHHLYVTEALEVLDMFLDKHINQLRESSITAYSVALFLITGRGLHSKGGQPKIKPAVKKRLDDYSIPFYELNPGLLGISINHNTILTSSRS